LNRLKLVDNRTHKIVYSDDNFLWEIGEDT
jgi:hypothetical protein